MIWPDHHNDHREGRRCLHETRLRKSAMTIPATMLEPSASLSWVEKFPPSDKAPTTEEAAVAAARHRAAALLRTDPDERLAHMASPEGVSAPTISGR